MTNLVERLRFQVPQRVPIVDTMKEAADEIERLQQHKRAQAEDIMSLGQQIGKLEKVNSILSNANLNQENFIHKLLTSLRTALALQDALLTEMLRLHEYANDKLPTSLLNAKDQFDTNMRALLDEPLPPPPNDNLDPEDPQDQGPSVLGGP